MEIIKEVMEVFLDIVMTIVMILIPIGGIVLSNLWPILFFSDPTIIHLLRIVSSVLMCVICIKLLEKMGGLK